MSTPTRFNHGVTNAGPSDDMYKLGMLDPTKFHVWFDDFDNYAVGQWLATATSAGAGTSAAAPQNEDGGVLKITNAAGDNDAYFLQWTGTDATAVIETFTLEAGKQVFIKARFKVSDADKTAMVLGLQIRDTTPLDVTDGLFLYSALDSASLIGYVEKNNTATTTTLHTLADDTYVVAAIYYNGRDKVEYFVNGACVGDSVVTNLCDDEELAISFGCQNGEAAVKTMSVDYIFVAKER
jgi:hypothetical protein